MKKVGYHIGRLQAAYFMIIHMQFCILKMSNNGTSMFCCKKGQVILDHHQICTSSVSLLVIMSTHAKGGGGHIVFGVDPVDFGVCVASFKRVIF